MRCGKYTLYQKACRWGCPVARIIVLCNYVLCSGLGKGQDKNADFQCKQTIYTRNNGAIQFCKTQFLSIWPYLKLGKCLFEIQWRNKKQFLKFRRLTWLNNVYAIVSANFQVSTSFTVLWRKGLGVHKHPLFLLQLNKKNLS